MSDLPVHPTPQTQNSAQGVPAESVHKEAEVAGVTPEASGVKEVGHEVTLAPDVQSAGVRVHPTTVTIPQPVASLGVKPVGGSFQTSQQSPVVALPLTDDQIAAGLHKSISSSVRWLATWCVRRLKQLHLALRNVGGKTMRINRK